MNSNPAFLVEGRMEQRIIQEICRGKPVRLIGCNGDRVSMEAVAKAIDAQMVLLKNNFPIVIIFDREDRMESCVKLEKELSGRLNALGHSDRYVIGIADRAVETWILADWESARTVFAGSKELGKYTEGTKGKAQIEKLLPEGTRYHETTVGVRLFLSCRSPNIYASCRSFQNFVRRLSINCDWLSGIPGRVAT